MRHDPAAAAVTIMLRSLKMHGMAQAAAELTEQGAPAFQSAIPILSQLLKAELAEREVRSIAYQLKAARFPTYKDLTGFDFASESLMVWSDVFMLARFFNETRWLLPFSFEYKKERFQIPPAITLRV